MQAEQPREPEINKLFRVLVKLQGSELLLEPEAAPALRLDGHVRLMEIKPLSSGDLWRLVGPTLSDDQLRAFNETGSVAFVHLISPSEARLKVLVTREDGRIRVTAQQVRV